MGTVWSYPFVMISFELIDYRNDYSRKLDCLVLPIKLGMLWRTGANNLNLKKKWPKLPEEEELAQDRGQMLI